MSDNFYNKYGINIKNESMFFSKSGNNTLDSKMMAIRAFTSTDYFRQLLYRIKGFKLTRLDSEKIRMIYKEDAIEFSMFSDLLLVENEEIKNTKRELLNYMQRKGQCHYKSLTFISIGDYLVTGYVDDSVIKKRIVHSWIETERNVIDYTSNLVIKKEDYYKLMNVEILSVINKEDVLKDLESDFINSFLGAKFYCLFREELERQGLIQLELNKLVKKL